MADTSKEHLLSEVNSSYHDELSDNLSEGYYVHSDEKAGAKQHKPWSRRSQVLVCTLLFLSLVWNGGFILEKFVNRKEIAARIKQQTTTRFAGLEYNAIGTPITYEGIYSIGPDGNETARDELWEAINIDRSVIVLDQEEAQRLGLEATDTFAWDSTKKVYIVNAFHQLHCLKILYWAVTDDYKDNPRSQNYAHLFHCLDALRQDVICHADDELLFEFETDNPDSRPRVGEGHIRQCRNFAKLEEWALAPERNACYQFYEGDDSKDKLKNWRHCPPNSPYFQSMKEYFGYDEDWQIDYTLHLDHLFPGEGGS